MQIITDDKAFNIPFDKLKYCEKPLYVKIGDCIFSDKGITLDFQSDDLTLKGMLYFKDLTPIRYDIMGPFKFIPFMQCRHRVYSMSHIINGEIIVIIFISFFDHRKGELGIPNCTKYLYYRLSSSSVAISVLSNLIILSSCEPKERKLTLPYQMVALSIMVNF